MISNIVRSIINKDKYNILTFVHHNEKYLDLLSHTNHNFYLWTADVPSWDWRICPKPDNFYLLPKEKSIPIWLDIDIILCHNRMSFYPIAQSISNFTYAPLILFDNKGIESIFGVSPHNINKIPEQEWNKIGNRKGHINVYSSNSIRESLAGTGFVIYPSCQDVVNMETYSEKVICTHTDIEDFHLLTLRECAPDITIRYIGEYKNKEEKARQYKSSQMYINMKNGDVSINILEAMSYGIPIISLYSPDMDYLIIDGYNGFVFNNTHELKSKINILNNNKNLKNMIIKNALSTVSKYQFSDFLSNWQDVFNFSKTLIFRFI